MKFVTVRDFRSRPRQVWNALESSKEMIVTSKGKPIALLTPLSENTMENTLANVRRVQAMSALHSLQTASVASGTDALTLEEINREIRIVRSKRKR